MKQWEYSMYSLMFMLLRVKSKFLPPPNKNMIHLIHNVWYTKTKLNMVTCFYLPATIYIFSVWLSKSQFSREIQARPEEWITPWLLFWGLDFSTINPTLGTGLDSEGLVAMWENTARSPSRKNLSAKLHRLSTSKTIDVQQRREDPRAKTWMLHLWASLGPYTKIQVLLDIFYLPWMKNNPGLFP